MRFVITTSIVRCMMIISLHGGYTEFSKNDDLIKISKLVMQIQMKSFTVPNSSECLSLHLIVITFLLSESSISICARSCPIINYLWDKIAPNLISPVPTFSFVFRAGLKWVIIVSPVIIFLSLMNVHLTLSSYLHNNWYKASVSEV